jgi:hypothetical protein
MEEQKPQTELAKKEETAVDVMGGLAPTPQTEFLKTLIESKKLPAHVKTVADAFTIAQMGKELGFQTMQALHYIVPIDGKLTLSARAVNAILRRGGVKMKTLEDGVYVWADGKTTRYASRPDTKELPLDRRTTIRFMRDGIEEDCEFTFKDAEKQGLTAKSNWVRMVREMLFARCLARGANRIGADLMLGLYMAEEIADAFRVDENLIKRNEEGFIEEIQVPGKVKVTVTDPAEKTEDISHEDIRVAA